MPQRYTVQHDDIEDTYTVISVATGMPAMAAGVPQIGLTEEGAHEQAQALEAKLSEEE